MYYHYTIIQWLFFFYFYCFVGWCIESSYVSLKERKWVNRGFMKGPFLPLYGSGSIIMLVVSQPFAEHWWAVYLAGCIGATVLEYVTGVVMEVLFKVRYWNYFKQPYNFQGYICLGTSLAWGVLTLFMTYVIHQPIEHIVFLLREKYLTLITILLTFYIVGDFTLSFRVALDLRDILIRMEKLKENLVHVQKRLEVIMAVAGDAITESLGQYKDVIVDKLKIEDVKENIEKMLDYVKESIHKKTAEYSDDTKKELFDLHTEYKVNAEKQEGFGKRNSLIRRIRNNPTMSSMKYKDALDELKRQADSKKNQKEK
ncbi:MAG TPA: putative ABC transporter permease [Lachnospiraceae bacterium]|nr:putative ABC transporter permease [Lachnospiraceae bacterium]